MDANELMWVIAFGYIIGRIGYSLLNGIILGVVASFAKKERGN